MELYGAPWLQLVAINGKSDGRGSAESKPKPLPSVATGCREKYMVRRGRRFESVRGLCKSPANRGFTFRIYLHALQYAVGMEPFMELSGPERPFLEP
jgi:hypothetical protein